MPVPATVERRCVRLQPGALAIGKPQRCDTHVERYPAFDPDDLDPRAGRREQRGELGGEQALGRAGLQEGDGSDQDDQHQAEGVQKPAESTQHHAATATAA
ncbi:MAG: hypothetical protein HC871_12360 [Rhizobiales bacterium]|nr:hypothetical protein [Hyphomicrobiales bacterium]